ncbi:MAG: hypothetical protein HYT87_06810 [Nitrospirae bacterium]|nr:hypothetical protein [Nitrospirota bacterium]
MKLGIRLLSVMLPVLAVGAGCPENVGTVFIQLAQPPAQYARPLAGVRQLTVRVERDGRVVKERTFSRLDEYELGNVGPISNAYIVLEGETVAGETRRGKAGPIDLGAARGDTSMVVTLFLGDVEGFSPFAEISSARAHHATAVLPSGDLLVTGGEIAESLGGGTAKRSVGLYELLDAHSLELVALQPRFGFSPNARSQHTATVNQDSRVVLIGGANKQPSQANAEDGELRDDVEIFDPRQTLARLGQGPKLTFGRRQHTATLLGDGTILVAGGFGGEGRARLPGKVMPFPNEKTGEMSAGAELIDVDAMSDTALREGAMVCPRAGHTATYIPGMDVVVLAGGVTSDGGPADCVEIYYPDRRRFEAAAMIPSDGQSTWVGRSGMAAVYLPSIERLALIGGFRRELDEAGKDTGKVASVNYLDLVAFDPASRGISGFERILIPQRIGDRDVKAAARGGMKVVELRDGRILLAGGTGYDLGFKGEVRLLDWMYFTPETREVSFSFNVLSQARRIGHTVDILPNGEVVLIGGEVDELSPSRLVEWYTPKE